MPAANISETIDRIITIIKNNSIIYDEKNFDDKLQSVDYGEVDNLVYDKASPYVLVTIPDSPYVTAEEYGRSNDTRQQDRLEFLIKIISNTNSSENTERELARYLKEIVETLRANPTLHHPTNNDDPKCSRLYITRYGIIPQYRGQELQIAEITVRCQVGDQITINVPTLGEIPVLGVSDSPYGWTTQNIPDADGNRDVVPVIFEGKKFIKVEYTSGLNTALGIIIKNFSKTTLTYNKDGSTEQLSVKISRKSDPYDFDKISLIVLEVHTLKGSL